MISGVCTIIRHSTAYYTLSGGIMFQGNESDYTMYLIKDYTPHQVIVIR